MVVIGGGVIGLELGSVWRRLGAKVTVRRIPRPDPARHRRRRPQGMQQDLQEAGLRLQASAPRSPGVKVKGGKATLTVEPAKGGAAETIEADCVLVSIGRRPNTDGLGLDKVGLKTNDRGQIETDHDFRTSGRRRLGDRRRHPRPDARPQGRGRGHCGRREYRRPDRHREPRRHPVGGLHHARDRRRRPDRGAGARSMARSRSASSRCSPTAAPRPTTRPTAS